MSVCRQREFYIVYPKSDASEVCPIIVEPHRTTSYDGVNVKPGGLCSNPSESPYTSISFYKSGTIRRRHLLYHKAYYSKLQTAHLGWLDVHLSERCFITSFLKEHGAMNIGVRSLWPPGIIQPSVSVPSGGRICRVLQLDCVKPSPIKAQCPFQGKFQDIPFLSVQKLASDRG